MLGWFNLRNSETLRYKTEGAGLTAKNIYVYAVSSNVFHDDASTHDLLVPKSGGSAVRLDWIYDVNFCLIINVLLNFIFAGLFLIIFFYLS